jgi:hypothetical protein
MITVSILINGEPLVARSCKRVDGEAGEICTYFTDCGHEIEHNYNDGAVALAHKLLDLIHEKSDKEG